MARLPEITLVIPFFNEEGSLDILYDRIVSVLGPLGKEFELIFVNDGSTDSSLTIIEGISSKDHRVSVIGFPSNRGKAAALAKGFAAAQGATVFTLDADLQDDPTEIPNFLAKMNEGYDLVSGWKQVRHDPLEKRLPSRLFNKVTSLISGVELHDFNCGFKAYKREILDEVKLYGDLHRYIPALAHWLGYRVGEIPVKHHARAHGKSKYGWERYFRGFFDLITVLVLTKHIRNPIQFFGAIGSLALLLGLFIVSGLTVLQISYGSILGHKPLSYLSVLLILFGSQSLSLGLLSEMLTSVSLKKGRPRISIRRRLIHKKGGTPPELSVVIPIHNERESLVELYERLMPVLAELALSYEIVFVDDGSTDGSTTILEGFFEGESRVTLVELRRRSGKASALQVGFNHAQGDIICTLDGDLQDRPEDLGMLVQKVKGGADFAVGRRRGVSKLQAILSGAFNRLVATLTSVEIHDFNCGLRAFRKRVIQNVVLRGELHRFFPVLVAAKGFRVEEVDVAHLRRMAGRSKYDLSRIPKAFLDLFAVVLLAGYVRRPLHLFGSVGITISALGLAITGYLTALKLSTGNIGDHYTLLLFGVMFVVLGLQWFGTGVIGELLNNYFADDAD